MKNPIWQTHDPEFTRRTLLRLAALAPIAGTARAAGPEFAGKSLTFASWGGAFQDAQATCYCAPFAAASGAKVLQAGPVEYAKLRTMIQAGQPVWDVVDITIEFLYTAAKDGLFEKIDPTVAYVDRIKPAFRHEYGVGDIVWSYNIAYSPSAYPDGKGPQSWADVFDVNRFAGTRTLRDRVALMLEIARQPATSAPGFSGVSPAGRQYNLDQLIDTSSHRRATDNRGWAGSINSVPPATDRSSRAASQPRPPMALTFPAPPTGRKTPPPVLPSPASSTLPPSSGGCCACSPAVSSSVNRAMLQTEPSP